MPLCKGFFGCVLFPRGMCRTNFWIKCSFSLEVKNKSAVEINNITPFYGSRDNQSFVHAVPLSILVTDWKATFKFILISNDPHIQDISFFYSVSKQKPYMYYLFTVESCKRRIFSCSGRHIRRLISQLFHVTPLFLHSAFQSSWRNPLLYFLCLLSNLNFTGCFSIAQWATCLKRTNLKLILKQNILKFNACDTFLIHVIFAWLSLL